MSKVSESRFPQLSELVFEIGAFSLEAKQDFLKKRGEEDGYVFMPKILFSNETVLSIYSRVLYAWLMDCVRKKGKGLCFPSTAALALNACMSKRQVVKSLLELRDEGWIDWITNPYAKGMTDKKYRSRLFRIYSESERRMRLQSVSNSNSIEKEQKVNKV